MKEQEKVLMGQRELKRWHLMEMVEAGGGSMGSVQEFRNCFDIFRYL
jgi:hypothetical protein